MGEPSLPALQTAVLDILEDSIKTPGVIYEETAARICRGVFSVRYRCTVGVNAPAWLRGTGTW